MGEAPRTTATKPKNCVMAVLTDIRADMIKQVHRSISLRKQLPKKLSFEMLALIQIDGKINQNTLFTPDSILVAGGIHGTRNLIPVLVTVTPIRAKRAGGRRAAGEGKRGRGA